MGPFALWPLNHNIEYGPRPTRPAYPTELPSHVVAA